MRTYIDALAKGTVSQYDMSTMGVTSTMMRSRLSMPMVA